MSMPSLDRRLRAAALAAALMAVVAPIVSRDAMANERVVLTERSLADLQQQAELFAAGHPDEVWRFRGLYAHSVGRDADAVANFERAASYADKYAQYYLSLMYWHGQGVARDAVQAYIWSDIAAERGGKRLLAFRERLWRELTPAQRDDVVTRGPATYAAYGDATTKPRMEWALLRFRASTTGSRLGYVGSAMNVNLGSPAPGAVGGFSTGEQLYAEHRMQADAYWAAKQAELERGAGRIEIGQIESPEDGAGSAPEAPTSALPRPAVPTPSPGP